MDLSFDIKNTEGDQIMVALSYYDAETIRMFSTDPKTLTLIFYDVTLVRKKGDGYVGHKMLYAISDTLAKFLNENEDAVLCFYCDSGTDIKRSHSNLLPQEYRSALFSRMFEWYTKSHSISGFINHRVKIEDRERAENTQFAHFICRECHQDAVNAIGHLLMEK